MSETAHPVPWRKSVDRERDRRQSPPVHPGKNRLAPGRQPWENDSETGTQV